MDQELLNRLTEKINNGTASDEELGLFTAFINTLSSSDVDWAREHPDGPKALKNQLFASIQSLIAPAPKVKLFPWKRIAIAASLLLCVFTAGYLLIDREKIDSPQIAKNKEEIIPGGNKATLTLADGRTIVLSSDQKGIITGNQITYENGALIDNAISNSVNASQNLLSVHTPRGGMYSVTLPDGTDVWLNAETTIKYPVQFDKNERIVELQGEAYFHVKANYNHNGEKIPFKVVNKNQTVEVLGTQFNMTAYPDQPTVKTTLVEGKVAVSTKNDRLLLKPNQQALTLNGKTTIKAVDVDNFIAWRTGKFSFDGKTIDETLDEIGRWYDLDIVYENGIPNVALSGDAYRNENINFVFRLLKVARVNYKLNVATRKLIITK